MTIFPIAHVAKTGPRYVAIADAIEAALNAGELHPGDRLPAHRPLAFDLGVTVGTISRAYELAARRGLVEGSVGRGTFVCGDGATKRRTRGVGSAEFMAMQDTGLIPMRANLPASTGQNAIVAGALEALMRQPDFRAHVADYAEPGGSAAQREAAAHWFGHADFSPDPDGLVLTAGAQQALATAIAVATEPGDLILTEAFTYRVIATQCQLMGRRLRPVAMDANGMMPDALDEAARAHRPRAVFIIPTLQNPTGIVMDAKRRHAIADVAARHDLLTIEDDIYGKLTDPTQPLAALLPEAGFFVSSLSKCVAPGLRIGAIICPPRFAARARTAQHAFGQGLPPMTGETARHLVESGGAQTLQERQRAEIRDRNKAAYEALSHWLPTRHPHSAHLWIELPPEWRIHDFMEATRTRGIAIASDEDFAVTAPTAERHVRVALGPAADTAECKKGIGILKDLLTEGPLGAA